MENRLGFIKEKFEIKTLILYILSQLPDSVSIDTLAEQSLIDEGINYFSFADCVQEMVSSGHVKCENGMYSITKKGIDNSSITAESIPFTVKYTADRNLTELSKQINRASQIKISRGVRRGGGYNVNLSLSDGLGEILAMQLYAVDEKQSIEFENGFRDKAEAVYKAILNTIE